MQIRVQKTDRPTNKRALIKSLHLLGYIVAFLDALGGSMGTDIYILPSRSNIEPNNAIDSVDFAGFFVTTTVYVFQHLTYPESTRS